MRWSGLIIPIRQHLQAFNFFSDLSDESWLVVEADAGLVPVGYVFPSKLCGKVNG